MIYQQPECVPTANPFTISDLLAVQHDFPESPYVYFGNNDDTVICIVSPFNPADQWCSGKAPEWSPPQTGWSVFNYVAPPPAGGIPGQYVPPPNHWQPPVVTPEPLHVVFLLALLFLIALIRTLK